MSNTHGTQWANPLPAGLIALAISVFIFYAVLTGKVHPEGMGIAGIWLIGGFIVQVIVGIVELRLGNLVGGNTFTWFSAYFMLVTGLVWLFQYFANIYGWKFDHHVVGWAWCAITIVLWLQFPMFAKTMPLTVFAIIAVLNLSLPLITGINLGLLDPKVYAPIAGNMAGIAGLLAAYSAAAVLNNGAFGRQLFPFPGPIIRSSSKIAGECPESV